MLISPAVRPKALLLAVGFYGCPGIPDALTHRPLRAVAGVLGTVEFELGPHERTLLEHLGDQPIRRVLQIVQGLRDAASKLLAVAINDPGIRRRRRGLLDPL